MVAVNSDLPNPSQFNFLIFGMLLVVMMRFRPEGFIPSRQRAAELRHAPPGQAIGSAATLGDAAVAAEETADSLAATQEEESWPKPRSRRRRRRPPQRPRQRPPRARPAEPPQREGGGP